MTGEAQGGPEAEDASCTFFPWDPLGFDPSSVDTKEDTAAALVLPHPYPGNQTANKGYDWTKRQWLGWEEEPGLLLPPSTFLLPNPSHLPKVVANLFFGHAQVMARQRSLIRRSSTRTRRYKAPTVAARFQQSLLDLVGKMER